MSADYYLACTQCKVCFWVWWRNAGAACGPADVDAAALQAFVDAHLGHTITMIGDDDALDMDDQTARPERQRKERRQ